MNAPQSPPRLHVKRALERARGVDWWLHSIATSGKYNDSLLDIEQRWSVRQLTDALRVLDVWSAIERPPPKPRTS